MDKEQQIEEMTRDIYGQKSCDTSFEEDCKILAYDLVTLGYQKIDKDSAVLSREEQEKILTATEKRIKELKKQILQARKETAEKFAANLKNVIHERDYIRGYAKIGLIEEIDELLKEYEK